MKTKQSALFVIILFSLFHSLNVNAKDPANTANEIETPDALLQNVAPKDKKVKYGDSDISISPNGKKENALVAPDPLERQLEAKKKKQKDQPVSKKIKKARDTKIKKTQKPRPDQNIETPDPLLNF